MHAPYMHQKKNMHESHMHHMHQCMYFFLCLPYVSTNLESPPLPAITEAEDPQPAVSNNKTTRLSPPKTVDAVNATPAMTMISMKMKTDSWKTKILQKLPRPRYQLH